MSKLPLTYEEFLTVIDFMSSCTKSGIIEAEQVEEFFPVICQIGRILTSVLLMYSSSENMSVERAFGEIIQLDGEIADSLRAEIPSKDILLDESAKLSKA